MIDIFSSFISRNNDVNGYWGIGKLYGFIRIKKLLVLEIDLLNRTMSLDHDEFNYRLNFYTDKLKKGVEKRFLKMSNISKATICLFKVDRNTLLYL